MSTVMVRAMICCPMCGQRVRIQKDGNPAAHWTVPGIALMCPQSWPRWAKG